MTSETHPQKPNLQKPNLQKPNLHKPKLRPSKVSEKVAKEIVNDITRRGLGPGVRLGSEREMLERYGVARGSLREAIRILEVYGVLEIKPGAGGGPVVRRVGSHDVGQMATLFFQLGGVTYGDLIEARLMLDPTMARLAAERRDQDALEQLDAVIEQQRATPIENSDWVDVGTAFHRVVAGISGNKVFDTFGRALMDIYTNHLPNRVEYPIDTRRSINEAHEKIAKAIKNGDASEAENLMRSHMVDFFQHIKSRYPGFLEDVIEWL